MYPKVQLPRDYDDFNDQVGWYCRAAHWSNHEGDPWNRFVYLMLFLSGRLRRLESENKALKEKLEQLEDVEHRLTLLENGWDF